MNDFQGLVFLSPLEITLDVGGSQVCRMQTLADRVQTQFCVLQCLELSVVLSMVRGERRFGFSVVGGVDEGLTPRVDDIQPGECKVFRGSALYVSTCLLAMCCCKNLFNAEFVRNLMAPCKEPLSVALFRIVYRR
jgi:hypothetical protein